MRVILQLVILIAGVTMLLRNRTFGEELVRSAERSPFGGQPPSLKRARGSIKIAGSIFIFAATFGLITGR